jgi:hypothetical protein
MRNFVNLLAGEPMIRNCVRCVGILILAASASAYARDFTSLQLSVIEPVQLFPKTYDVYGLRFNLVEGKNYDVCGLDLGLSNQVVGDMIGAQIGALWNYNLAEYLEDYSRTQQPRVSWTDGFQVSGLCNFACMLDGVQVALALNCTESMNGVGIGGFANNVAEQFNGLQLAGAVNTCGIMDGAQLAGLVNYAAADVTGAQLAGLVNYTPKFVLGAQVAGCYNGAAAAKGLQLSLFGNRAEKEFIGYQITGFYNRAGDARGVQVGLYNRAGERMSGFQFGLVNCCAHLRGVQLGLLNISFRQDWPVLPVLNVRF